MNTRMIAHGVRWLALGLACLASGAVTGVAAEPSVVADATNAPAVTNSAPTNAAPEDQALRSYLEVQAKLHSTLLAIEQARQEASAASMSNAAVLAHRLEQMEQALAEQREREREASARWNSTLLLSAAAFAGIGVLGLMLVVFFQMRGMNRLAEIATGIPTGRALGSGGALAVLGPGEAPLPALPANAGDAARLFGVIDRLEKRIQELEAATRSGGDGPPSHPMDAGPAARIASLVGKGQALLNADKAQEAVGCFEEALALDGRHAPAWAQKGKALAKLQNPSEAIACFDRALAADPTFTQALILKGGVLHQLERNEEAIECYERALRAPEKVRGA